MSRRKRRRKLAGLEKVERRELAAFVLGQRTDQRVRDRDDDDALPSRSALHDQERTSPNRAPDLLATFARAKELPQSDVPDLMSAFARAAREQDFSGGGHDSGTDPDHDVAAGANVYEYGRFESVVQGHGAKVCEGGAQRWVHRSSKTALPRRRRLQEARRKRFDLLLQKNTECPNDQIFHALSYRPKTSSFGPAVTHDKGNDKPHEPDGSEHSH